MSGAGRRSPDPPAVAAAIDAVPDGAGYPPPRVAWYAVAVLLLAYVSSIADRAVVGLLVEPIKRAFAVDDFQVSLLVGVSFTVFYTLLGLPAGRLADRRSRRGLAAWGVALWSLATVWCGLARSYGALFAGRVGVGVGEATLGPAAYSMIADLFPGERRATALSVYNMGISVGTGIAVLLAGLVAGLTARGATLAVPLAGAVPSWQVVFLVIGLPGLLVSLLLLTVPEPVRRRSPAARGAAEPNAGRGAALAWVRAHWRAYTALAVGFGLFNVYNQGVGFFVPALFMRTHGWTAARIGVTQGLLTAVLGTVGLLAAGRVADRLGRGGRTDGRVRTLLGCSLALLATGATLPLMPTAGGAVALLAASLLVAVAPYGVAAAALTEITPGPVRGRVAAMYLLVINLVGGGLGPVAVGAVSRYVLRDPALLRYAMSAVGAAALAGSAALYAWGLPHVRATRAAAEA